MELAGHGWGVPEMGAEAVEVEGIVGRLRKLSSYQRWVPGGAR
jgi:hypothetical protein